MFTGIPCSQKNQITIPYISEYKNEMNKNFNAIKP